MGAPGAGAPRWRKIMVTVRKRRGFVTILKWTAIVLLGLVVVLSATAFFVATSQTGMVRVIQLLVNKGEPVNSFAPRGPQAVKHLTSGQTVRTNIRYGDSLPNSFADIWYPASDGRASHPTIFYIHGGGWAFGDKDSGDPIAASGQASGSMLARITGEGFNVVNLDYVQSPEYHFPTPAKQLNEAIAYFTAHAADYGLDMDRVIVMGGSGGAHITAQYGLIVTNPSYAAEIGVTPALTPERLKALGVIVAPLRFSGLPWNPSFMMWSYLGTKDVNGPLARQADILAHLGADYPATYLTDGNGDDTFPAHAQEMARRLTDLGVDHDFYFVGRDVALLGHGYTGDMSTPYARENFTRMIAFYRSHTGGATPADQSQRRPPSSPAD